MTTPLFERVAIIGPGLIGGSLGMRLRGSRIAGSVIGVGHRQISLDKALAAGAIDEATLDPAAAAADADIVILAAGLGKIMEHIRALIPHMKPGALLTDVGSVKAAVCEVACEVIEGLDPPRIRFVGGHPLAGSEQRGIDAARADLFDGATCILTPPVETDPDGTALTALRLMWESVGCRVKEFSPEVHDRLLAEVSHLPHVVAAALIGAASDQALPLAATGFADTTRVASGNAALWVDVCLANRKELLAALATMQVQLSEFTTVLRSGDATALEALFQAAKQQRDTRFTAKEQA